MKFVFSRSVVVYLLALVATGPSVARAQKDLGKPYFSEEFIQSIQNGAPYPLVYSEKDMSGIKVPLINGRGIWGLSIRNGSGKPLNQLRYEASWLHAQGANYVRLSGFLGNDPSKILPAGGVTVPMSHFQDVYKTLCDYGIGFSLNHANIVKWQLPGWVDLNTLSGVEDMIIGPDGKKTTQHGTGNIYSEKFRNAVIDWQVKAATALTHNPAFRGIQVSNEPWVQVAPRNPEAIDDFRNFCMRYYGDDSPDKDTNGDGHTFNSANSTHYQSWAQVTTFDPNFSIDQAALKFTGVRTEDWRDTLGTGPQARLMRLWLGDIWGRRYQQVAANAVRHVRDDLYVCASTNGRLDGGEQDLATYASQPSVRALFRNTYDDPGMSFMAAAVANAYGKPAWHTEFNVYWRQDPKKADMMLAATIPYINGYEWYASSWNDDTDTKTDWGAKFNIVNYWSGKPAWAGKKYEEWSPDDSIAKPAEFDDRWRAFPKFAPFISYFNGIERAKASRVLWINGGPAFLTTRGMIFDSHATSDQALTLNPDALDLSHYKLAIYFTPHADHMMSRELYERLTDYVRKGGTLLVNAYQTGLGRDLRGVPNADYFRAGLKPAPESPKILAIYGDQKGHLSYLEPYLVNKLPKSRTTGPLIKYGQEPVIFRFPVPAGAQNIIVRDLQVPWDDGGKVEAAYSADGQQWTNLPASNLLFAVNNHQFKIAVTPQIQSAGAIYLRYLITRTKPEKNYGPLHAGHTSYIGMLGTHLRGLMVLAVDQAQNIGVCEQRLGDASQRQWIDLPLYEADGSQPLETRGSIRMPSGKEVPQLFIRTIGKGKLVMINDPDAYAFTRMGASLVPQERAERLAMLKAIARQTSGVELPTFDGLHVYQGPQAVLANYFEGDPFSLTIDSQKHLRSTTENEPVARKIDVAAASPKMVVFDTVEFKNIGGAFIESRNGRLVFSDSFRRPWAYHLWITKPYGRPIVLYCDGTLRKAAEIGDGQWDSSRRTLQLNLTDVAYISSPKAAQSISSSAIQMTYDSAQQLITLFGTGMPSAVTLQFE